MKYFKFLFMTIFLVVLIGCNGVDKKASYSLTEVKNYGVVAGPLRDATVKVYLYNNLNKVISTTKTGIFGGFSLDIDVNNDDELVLVEIQGGFDIDVNNDGFIDDNLTINKGTIRGWAKVSNLRNGIANITMFSEIVYQYTKHLIGNIHQDDFIQVLDSVTSRLFALNEDIKYTNSILNFNASDNSYESKLDINYSDLSTFAHNIHNGAKEVELKEILNSLYSMKLQFNMLGLLKHQTHYKVELFNSKRANFISTDANIYVKHEKNEIKLTDFLNAGESITIIADTNDKVKVVSWDGCDAVSKDKTECSIINIQKNTFVRPFIESKELTYKDNVVDLSSYNVSVIDDKYIVKLDALDNIETMSVINSIRTGDIIVKDSMDLKFYRKVVSVDSAGVNKYVIHTVDASILEVYNEGTSFHKYLTHKDLSDNIKNINKSLSKDGAILLPSKSDDDEFVIVYTDQSNLNLKTETFESDIGLLDFTILNTPEAKIYIRGIIKFKIEVTFNAGNVWLQSYVLSDVEGRLSLKLRGKVVDFDEKISLLGYNPITNEPRKLSFTPGFGLFKFKASVGLFVGAEAQLDGEVDIGLNINKKRLIGLTWVQGEGTTIHNIDPDPTLKDEYGNTVDVNNYGSLFENNPDIIFQARANAGAYFEIQPSIGITNIADFGSEIRTGLYFLSSYNFDTQESDAKIAWQSSVKPVFIIAPYLVNYLNLGGLENTINTFLSRFTGYYIHPLFHLIQ